MAGKDCIRACFFLLFVALAVGAPTLAPPPSCIERIHKIFSRPGGRNLMGGWRDVETPQNDATVKDIVVSSLNQYNNQPNNSNQYQLFEDGNVEAYSQSTRGRNYCVQFTLVSVGCKNGRNSDCSANTKLVCSVTAFKGLRDTEATVDPKTLDCKTVESTVVEYQIIDY